MSLRSKEHLYKVFKKLRKKDRKKLEIINKKVAEILENPHRYKTLRVPLENKRRVHIDKSFVLIYSIDEKKKAVIIEEYEHHNKVYFGIAFGNPSILIRFAHEYTSEQELYDHRM